MYDNDIQKIFRYFYFLCLSWSTAGKKQQCYKKAFLKKYFYGIMKKVMRLWFPRFISKNNAL